MGQRTEGTTACWRLPVRPNVSSKDGRSDEVTVTVVAASDSEPTFVVRALADPTYSISLSSKLLQPSCATMCDREASSSAFG